jgi:5-methylcytosine-specific restriction enzyme B
LPQDFRIIATLNSFDRHFLNQMSEAIKRRFDFNDVIPPPPRMARYEQGIAAMQALRKLRHNGFTTIQIEGPQGYPTYHWVDTLRVVPARDDENQARYHLDVQSAEASEFLEAFWHIFEAIRVFRQLGTAQVIALYANLFAGVLVGMPWEMALDTALADSLVDQLQVMTYDEQKVLELYLHYAGDSERFTAMFNSLQINIGRRLSLLYALQSAESKRNGTVTINVSDENKLSLEPVQMERVFTFRTLPPLPTFRQRLLDLLGQRGL